MQQPPSMFPLMPSFPPSDITTEQIQKYLDENKKLILAILDNQNLGKLAECAQYQAQLQKNLMYLAAIADAQPQTPPMPSPMSLHPAMQQGVFYMAQQAGMFQQRLPFSSPHPLQDPNNQQSHPQGQLTLRSTNGVDPPHSDANLGGASSSIPTSNYKPGSRGDGLGKSTGGGGGGDAEEAK